MKQIELEYWISSPVEPNKLEYAGQRKAQEVFAEIKHRLESIGMLPDEYFDIADYWENGREIPKDAEIFSTVQYGGSEGIYLDIGIKWHEDGNISMKSFATGKTLGDSESHLDRMYLTASAVNKALYSNTPHARYILAGSTEKTREAAILHLNGAERQLLIDSLVDRRSRLLDEATATEHLLRRVVGSITEFVNEVGAKPLQVSDYDVAVLAIADGNLTQFREVYENAPDKFGALLICAAGRPGNVGFMITCDILATATSVTNEEYLTACKNAVATGDTKRVLMLAEDAEKCISDLDKGIFGQIISEAISQTQGKMALEIAKQCTPEQIQAANPYILAQAIFARDSQLAFALADKGIDVTFNASDLIHALNYRNDGWMLKHLFERGMKLDTRNLSAMQACIKLDSVEMGKLLIDRGMDFAKYEKWDKSASPDNATFTALKEYWHETASNELAPVKVEKPDLSTRLAEGKAKAAEHNAARPASETPQRNSAVEH